MKRPWLWILVVIAGCTNNTKIPSGIIERPKMEAIMWDMIRADRYANVYLMSDTANKTRKTFELYANVFNLHHITQDEFLKSYKFYLSRPDLLKLVFDSVSARAERRRADVYKVGTRDSLARRSDSAMHRNRQLFRDSAKLRGDSLRKRPGSLFHVRDSIRKRRDSVLKIQPGRRRADSLNR